MQKRPKGTCRHKGGCSNAALRGNYNFCAEHRTPKQDVRQDSRTSIARAFLGSSSNATTHATTTTTTDGAAQHGENNDHIINDNNDDDDDVIMDEFGNGIPDIIVLDSRGEPEGPATPANDAASSLLNSSDHPATPSVFGAMAGSVISPDPTSPKWCYALPEQTMRHARLKVGQLFGVLTLLPIINMLGHLASHASGKLCPCTTPLIPYKQYLLPCQG